MKKMQSYFSLVIMAVALVNTGCKKYQQQPVAPGDNTTTPKKKWMVTTVAGNGNPFFLDGPALSAKFRLPLDVAVDKDGTIYVADGLNHRIRKISGGWVSTFAGLGIQDTTDANGLLAGFSIPSRIAIDAAGNLYTLDALDARVRMITPAAEVSTIAGTVSTGFVDGSLTTGRLGRCFGVVVDDAGYVYVSDAGNFRIRKIANNQLGTIAGTGIQGYRDGDGDTAQFFFPQGIAIDALGNLFIADQTKIRKISPAGVVSTFAGGEFPDFADGAAEQARFTTIEDLVIDSAGNLYATDENRVRKISPEGIVSTIAGSVGGYEDGEGANAKFNGAIGLGIDHDGNIYVADANNSRIRKISFQ